MLRAALPAPPLRRPLTFAWDVVAAASELPALRQLAATATSANSARLAIPSGLAASLATGAYTVRMNVTNWLGVTSEWLPCAGWRCRRRCCLLPAGLQPTTSQNLEKAPWGAPGPVSVQTPGLS